MIAWNKSTAGPQVLKVDNAIEWIRAAEIPSLWRPPSSLSSVIPWNPPLPQLSQSCFPLNLAMIFHLNSFAALPLQICFWRKANYGVLPSRFPFTKPGPRICYDGGSPWGSLHSWTCWSVSWGQQAILNTSKKLKDNCEFIWIRLYRLTITTGIITTQHDPSRWGQKLGLHSLGFWISPHSAIQGWLHIAW